MPDGFVLNQNDVDRIQALLDAYESGRLNPIKPVRPVVQQPPLWTHLVKTTSAISAASGSTPGTGTGEYWQLDPSALTLGDSGVASPGLFNPTGWQIPSGQFAIAARDPWSGQDWILPVATQPGVNLQTGTTYTLAPSDYAQLVTITNAAAQTITLPTPGASAGFPAGWYCSIQFRGAGQGTLSNAVSATVDGAATLAVPSSQGVFLITDGNNWYTERGMLSTIGPAVSVPANSTVNIAGGVQLEINLVGPTSNYLVTGGGTYIIGPTVSVFNIKPADLEINATIFNINVGPTINNFALTINRLALGVNITPGIVKQNTTAATAGTPGQNSPTQQYKGTAYNGTSSIPFAVDTGGRAKNTGGAGATAQYAVSVNVNGAGNNDIMRVAGDGALELPVAGSSLNLAGATSGTVKIVPPATGGGTITLPAGNVTLASSISFATPTAGANSQGSVTLSANSANSVSVPAANDAVTLPSASTGEPVLVHNASSTNTMNVYPASGESISSGAVNTATFVNASATTLFYPTTTGNWRTASLT